MTREYTGWRAELDHLWRKFVIQCESIEEQPAEISSSATEEEKLHAKGFYSGRAFAAKSIRRSVDHPYYNPTIYPYFARPLLSEQFDEKERECIREAAFYFDTSLGLGSQSTSYKAWMQDAKLWHRAAEMAREAGD